MAEVENPLQQLTPEHQEIVQSTWSQLLGAEGNTQNLAMDLFKSLVKTHLAGGQFGGDSREGTGERPEGEQQMGQDGTAYGGSGSRGGNDDLFRQLGGLAGQFLNSRVRDQGNAEQQGNGNHGGGNDFLGQLGGLAGHFLGGQGRQSHSQPGNTEGEGAGDSGNFGGGGSGGGGNFMDTIGGLARQFGGGNSGGGGGNILQMIGNLGGLAALANGLQDPGSLLSFFMKTPVAEDAANPDNTSRDIYKTIKGVIFNLLGSKLPAEDFSENSEAKGAWKNYMGVIAKALRNFAG